LAYVIAIITDLAVTVTTTQTLHWYKTWTIIKRFITIIVDKALQQTMTCTQVAWTTKH